MALPELDMSDDLEAEGELDDLEDGGDEPLPEDASADVDPMFAADLEETGLDLDDAQAAALQRAVLGLISSFGGGGPPSGGGPMGSPAMLA
jgi:hypothetical protein